jgi:hypothetical protein
MEVPTNALCWLLGQKLPLVLLVPLQEDREPEVQELQSTPDETGFMARFEHVAPGDYLVAVELTK